MNCRNLKPTSHLRRSQSGDISNFQSKFNRNNRYCIIKAKRIEYILEWNVNVYKLYAVEYINSLIYILFSLF